MESDQAEGGDLNWSGSNWSYFFNPHDKSKNWQIYDQLLFKWRLRNTVVLVIHCKLYIFILIIRKCDPNIKKSNEKSTILQIKPAVINILGNLVSQYTWRSMSAIYLLRLTHLVSYFILWDRYINNNFHTFNCNLQVYISGLQQKWYVWYKSKQSIHTNPNHICIWYLPGWWAMFSG